jgi:hypothetical protein
VVVATPYGEEQAKQEIEVKIEEIEDLLCQQTQTSHLVGHKVPPLHTHTHTH